MTGIREEIIDVETADGTMAVLAKRPEGDEPVPTVLIFHDAPGIRGSMHDFARRFAAEGYRIILPDLFYRRGRMLGWEADEITPEVRQMVNDNLYSLTDETIQQDVDAALEAFNIAVDEPMGTIGFCLGARAIYRTIMRLPDRFVVGSTWHPSLLVDDTEDSPHLTAHELSRPVYVGIGTADQIQSIEMQQKFFDAVEPLDHVEVVIFEGADHGFTWPKAPNYHEQAATVSWMKTTELFARVLKGE